MTRVTFVHGDITKQSVDAIVNAANPTLLGGGGVDGAIHRVGGGEITAACRKLRNTRFPDGLPTGQAIPTVAGRLPARHVIHVVGPVYSATEDRAHLLRSCYWEALRYADILGARTLALPAVSAGAYGWPLEDAARIGVGTVRLAKSDLEEARFVLYTERTFRAFRLAAWLLEIDEKFGRPGSHS
jgi:O-acetyl-ADP-ribose deacetylase (regulator of RNase III)